MTTSTPAPPAPPAKPATPATYRESDGEAVEMADAKAAWIPFAREALTRVAGDYNALIDYATLAEEVQVKSSIRTRQLKHYWVGAVLGAVGQDCQRRGEPLLSSLCVQKDGHVGAGYGTALAELAGGVAPDDVDMAAAEERLRCYAYFGATLPADGGRPTLTPQVAAKRRVIARKAREDIRKPVCPTCYLTLPATGQCDNCA